MIITLWVEQRASKVDDEGEPTGEDTARAEETAPDEELMALGDETTEETTEQPQQQEQEAATEETQPAAEEGLTIKICNKLCDIQSRDATELHKRAFIAHSLLQYYRP